MGNLSGIMEQLKKERDRVERELGGLNAALAAFVSVYAGTPQPNGKGRKVSAKSRAKMAAAQKARWAKTKRDSQPVAAKGDSAPAKRTMSALARRKIAAAQRARWARVKKAA
jgi:hypothetical protein